MDLSIEQVEILLLVVAITGIVARRLRIPYTVGLVLAGIAIALLPIFPNVNLTKELIFGIFLPPLVFEAALYIRWKELRPDLPVIVTLSTLGVVLAAAVTATGMYYLAHWDGFSAILFGVLIAATDPVSVIATFKEMGVHGRLRLLVEGESLFNDGTAAVGFSLALALALGGTPSPLGIAESLVTTVSGGILIGAVVTGGVLVLTGRTQDHLIEITFTIIAAYGSFLLAEQLHFSGVLASLTAGLLVGNITSLGAISEKGRESVESFWEYIAFVANSFIFVLIGISGIHQNFASILTIAPIAIGLVLLGRAIAVYFCCALFARSPLRVESGQQHILFWGGLRGALALALVLGLPTSLPRYEEIIAVTFAVVAFSIFVQGLSMTPFLNRLTSGG